MIRAPFRTDVPRTPRQIAWERELDAEIRKWRLLDESDEDIAVRLKVTPERVRRVR